MASRVESFVKTRGRGVATLALSTALVGFAGRAAQVSPPPSNDRPNIILIVLDTVRADAVGRAPGSSRTNTPFLDGWSRDALVFSGALSPADYTLVSHFSMLTGYPASAYGSDLDKPSASVVAQLNSAGYETIGISANPTVDPSLMRSVEPFQTFGKSPYVSPTPLSSDGWERIQRHDVRPTPGNLAKILTSAEAVNERVRRLLTTCRPAGGFTRPIFFFINFFDAHSPYFPSRSAGPSDSVLSSNWPQTGDFLRDRLEGPYVVLHEQPTPENVPRWRRADDLSARQIAFLRSLYDGEVRGLDMRLADTMNILREVGLLRRSVVVVTSDHGEAFGEQGFLSHGLEVHGIHLPVLYRVPLIIRAYGLRLKPVRRRAEVFSTATLSDSFRSWAGLKRGPGPELDSIATIEPSKRGRRDNPDSLAADSKASPDVPVATKTGKPTARDEELIRRLRSLGYIR